MKNFYSKILYGFFELCSFILLLVKIFTDCDITWFEVFIPILIPIGVCLFVVMVLLCQLSLLNEVDFKNLLHILQTEKVIDKKKKKSKKSE